MLTREQSIFIVARSDLERSDEHACQESKKESGSKAGSVFFPFPK
jgi:hypothetical protein